MDDDLLEHDDAPLDAAQVRRLLRLMDDALVEDSGSLPEQEVLRLSWGSSQAVQGPLLAPIGLLYDLLLDWQEGAALLPETQRAVREQVRILWTALGRRDTCTPASPAPALPKTSPRAWSEPAGLPMLSG